MVLLIEKISQSINNNTELIGNKNICDRGYIIWRF